MAGKKLFLLAFCCRFYAKEKTQFSQFLAFHISSVLSYFLLDGTRRTNLMTPEEHQSLVFQQNGLTETNRDSGNGNPMVSYTLS